MPLTFRHATAADLPRVIELIADDGIGKHREQAINLSNSYHKAFEAIDKDINQIPLVAEKNGVIVGYLQITFIPGLSRAGKWRGQLESVRVDSKYRNQGVGRTMVEHAIRLCRERACGLVQLTTDCRRADAKRFYEKLHFEPSHVGMKLIF